MEIISTSQGVGNLCQQIARTSKTIEHPFIAIDTEFLREKTYWPHLCLIQIGFMDKIWIIDPLLEEIDLAPFFDLLQNKDIVKVFHAARQDLEIFYHLSDKLPVPLFDTQIGAMVCGYKESVGYDTLVHDFLSIKLDKSSRATDWTHRPLSQDQLNYAADDVRYLAKVYELMKRRLQKLDREAWVTEEIATLTDPGTYQTLPEEAYKRLKFKKTHPRYLEALRQMAAWREEEARHHNLARPFIVKDDVIQDLALLDPETESAARNLRSLKNRPPSTGRLKMLLAALAKAREVPIKDCPSITAPSLKPIDRHVMNFLKLFLLDVAEKSGVAEKLIATSKELEVFAANPTNSSHKLRHGWRWELFGRKAETLLKGELKAFIQEGKLIFEYKSKTESVEN